MDGLVVGALRTLCLRFLFRNYSSPSILSHFSVTTMRDSPFSCWCGPFRCVPLSTSVPSVARTDSGYLSVNDQVISNKSWSAVKSHVTEPAQAEESGLELNSG